MKFTCTQENLARGLALVTRVASKNIALPILNNVLLIAEKGTVQLQTTNLELGVTVTIRAKVETDGRYTVQSRLLSDFITFLGNERVTMEATPQGLHISSGHTETTIKGLPPEEFPVMPVAAPTAVTTVPSAVLRQAIEGVSFAAANDESRPEISGVFIQCDGSTAILAATDSYRLAERKISLLQSVSEAISVILPSRTAQELLRLLPVDETQATLEIGEKQVVCKLPDIEIISRVIEGQYPDYHQIIPQQWKTKVVVPKDEFVANIRATSLFCQPGINDITLRVATNEKQITLSAANSQLGEHQASLPAGIEGEEKEIVFNYRYLVDGVLSLGETEVSLELGESQGPGLLRSTTGTDKLYLLMPIRQ